MLYPLRGKRPQLGPGCFVAPGARVIGDVIMGEGTTVWFNAVLRGDNLQPIRIGRFTNVQDGCILHTEDERGTVLGDYVTMGHRSIVHCATVHDRCLIGNGAIVLDGATVGPDAIVAAGAVVPPGAVIPPRSMAMGVPARVVRQLRDEELADIVQSAEDYYHRAQRYLADGWAPDGGGA